MTDHFPVFAIFQRLFDKTKGSRINRFKLIRYRTPEIIAALSEDLKNHNWSDVYASKDPNSAYDAFLSILIEKYEKHCLFKKTVKKQKNEDKPWITKGIEKACKKKNALYRKFIATRTIQAENKYKIYKNKLISIIRFSKKDYYNKLLDKHKNNIQTTWKVLNSIIKKNTGKVDYPNYFVNDDKLSINKMNDIVNEFNEYFVNIGSNLAKVIVEQRTGDRIDETNISSNDYSMFIRGVDEKEILDIVNNCKNKYSTDCNDIDMSLIKSIIEHVVKPFTHICNQSFLTGIFPSNMKTAKVIPIFKNGDRHCFSNYRPISLLSQFSKILEKIFVRRIDNFIDKHKWLSDHQFGFRTNRSTSMAVLELVEEISSSMDKNEYTVGVFLDLKKAFDTIDYGLLMMKLERYGIRGKALAWIKSYLDDRHQFVQMNNVKSDLMKVTCAVPQGSVLGPKLFVLYIMIFVKCLKY